MTLLVVRVAVDEERRASPLGRDALLEVLRGGDVSVERGIGHVQKRKAPAPSSGAHQGWERLHLRV